MNEQKVELKIGIIVNGRKTKCKRMSNSEIRRSSVDLTVGEMGLKGLMYMAVMINMSREMKQRRQA